MSIASLIFIVTGFISLLGALLLLICKSMLEDIDSLDEDENGFFDKRDRK